MTSKFISDGAKSGGGIFAASSRKRGVSMLPEDQRQQMGGLLFLISLFIFFISSILLYGLYAYWRRDDGPSGDPLPNSFLISTVCLLVISVLVHLATQAIRREKRQKTSALLAVSAISATVFMAIQFVAMADLLSAQSLREGTGRGVAGMVVVLAFLHALHVAGGVIALGIVALRSRRGHYDHERHWPVDFAAQYWHFLDGVWLCMLAAFWLTTGGFQW
ncbi:MAG: cytochrome c oxidase subunit 3 [Planctomycetota bacterium]